MDERELIDRAQIMDALLRYCRGVDRLDRDLILSSYHPGATDDHGSFVGSAEGFADWVIPDHRENYLFTSHVITNHYVEIDGDRAVSETYCRATLRFRRDGALFDLSGLGRYLDKWERRAGEWRIADRVVLGDWDRVDPGTETFGGDLVQQLKRGIRDETDLSYSFFDRAAVSAG